MTDMDLRNVVVPDSGVGYLVHVDPRPTMWGPVTHLEISNVGNTPLHSWKDLQWIKNEICGEERVAIEVYPSTDRLVDTTNSYHLWVLPQGFSIPFGIHDLDQLPPPVVTEEMLRGDFISLHCPGCVVLIEFEIIEGNNIQPLGQVAGRVVAGVVGKIKTVKERACEHCHKWIEVLAGPTGLTLIATEKPQKEETAEDATDEHF